MKPRDVLRMIWRWSPVVTLPVVATFLYWIIEVTRDYTNFGLRYATLNEYVDLHRIGSSKASLITRRGELALRPTIARPAGGLAQIDLFMGRSSENELNSALPHSGKHYVPGALIYPDGDIWEVKLKYRGDFFWHWSGAKKSLRVKAKKNHMFAGMRAFNLIGSKSKNKLSEQLSYFLGERMGILAPITDLVNVSIDGENRGVHFLIEQPEELVLRRNMRMPGDLYSGDIVAGDRYAGISASLFEHPGQWEKMAINNHYLTDTWRVIEELCMALAGEPSAERSSRVRELVDIPAFGRFAAYRSIIQSFHYDDHHNWRLYYDPWRNQFEPLLWDPDGWHEGMLPKAGQRAALDIVTSALDEVLFEDAEFLVARQIAMEAYFEDGTHEDLVAELDSLAERSRQSIEYDPALEHFLVVQSPEEVFEAQLELREMMGRIADDLRDAFMTPSTLSYAQNPEDPGRVQLSVDGRRPFTSVILGFEEACEGPLAATLSYWDARGRRDIDVTGALVRRGARVELDLPLLASFQVTHHPRALPRLKRQIEVAPGGYELVLTGAAIEHNALLDIVGVHNGGETVNGLQVEALEPTSLAQHGAIVPRPPSTPDVWQGTVHIEGVRHITGDVIIEPGTLVILAEKASLIIEGRLTALGTREEPIHFRGAEGASAPWGVVALRGAGASGSELLHCSMTGGSGYMVPLAEYSGMFSIHNVPGVKVHHSAFRDNFIVDDMVHAVNSKVTFSDCHFERALSDAIDLDMTEGIVERCHFVDSGNDALDLMTASVVLQDSVLSASGDKGVSVGEGTDVLIINVAIRDCLIGVQVKDRSTAVLYNCTLEGNGAAVDAYKKNWRYDFGGDAYVAKSVLSDNETNLTVGKRSSIQIVDSFVSGELEPTKRIIVAESVDDVSPSEPRSSDLPEPLEAGKLEGGLFKSHLSRANPRVRGARGLD